MVLLLAVLMDLVRVLESLLLRPIFGQLYQIWLLSSSTATLSGSDAPFQVAAGDALTLRLFIAGGLAGVQDLNSVVVTYRPVKDALAIEPAFTPQMSNFRSVAR